ncbi:MAG: fumarylacetoacetate hydrolase family protein [Bacteroidota bacterium]|jgi:2-keto-4-pentenoate hydratase/2-oxohepta-3-ene-1,7-dioic acid hydratase in catechol pathway
MMKIICVGRNYSDHIKELKNEKPDKPVIFCKPESVLLQSPAEFVLPAWDSKIHYECELVLRIGKDGKHIPEQAGNDWIDGIGLGIDFTARDLQEKLKNKGLPWERAKSFDGSAILGEIKPYKAGSYQFFMKLNDLVVQNGNTEQMLFSFSEIIADISSWMSLSKGDLIFTGTPAGVGPVTKGDVLKGYLDNQENFVCHIK